MGNKKKQTCRMGFLLDTLPNYFHCLINKHFFRWKRRLWYNLALRLYTSIFSHSHREIYPFHLQIMEKEKDGIMGKDSCSFIFADDIG